MNRTELIAKVTDIDAVAHLASEKIGTYSTGGMVTKLQAAKIAFASGNSQRDSERV